MVPLHDGILCNRKKERVLPFARAWMELENIILSEISHVVKEKYHMISPISGKTFCITGQSLHLKGSGKWPHLSCKRMCRSNEIMKVNIV